MESNIVYEVKSVGLCTGSVRSLGLFKTYDHACWCADQYVEHMTESIPKCVYRPDLSTAWHRVVVEEDKDNEDIVPISMALIIETALK